MPKVDNCTFWRVVVLFEIAAPTLIWWRSGSHADNWALWEQNVARGRLRSSVPAVSQQCPSRRGAPPAVYEMPKVDNCAFWRVVVLFEIAAPARIWWRSGSHADNCAFWEQNGSNASQLQSYSSMCGLHASRLADGSHCILTRCSWQQSRARVARPRSSLRSLNKLASLVSGEQTRFARCVGAGWLAKVTS